MKVLIGIDDSAESRHAVDVAHEFFGPDAHYVIFSVGEQTPLLTAVYPTGTYSSAIDLRNYFDVAQKQAERAAKEAAALLPDAEVRTATDMGRIGESLAVEAERQGCDVIVIGSQNKTVWQRLLDPSVGRYLIDNAHCPVLVVR